MSNVETVCFDLKNKNEIVFLNPNEIVMICLKSKLAEIYTKTGETYIIKNTLKEIESKLKGDNFFRSHKSFLVNLNYIKRIINNYGEWEIEFFCIEEKAIISRRGRKELKKVVINLNR
ncbi:LytTR family DNA-binding domain-containing protein [Thermoanaerobacterium sp. DL9XJH110]|uniref:LytTR family DNA-binding domain-containing protein n=1 Tax=Thermoanaerobacterium sp. DL9XJH110 TaxID=3386643 RepID=UPI003BB6C9AE